MCLKHYYKMEQALWLITTSEGMLSKHLKPKDLLILSLSNKEMRNALQPTLLDKCTKEKAFIHMLHDITAKINHLKMTHKFPEMDMSVCFHIFPDKLVKLHCDNEMNFKLSITNEHRQKVFESVFTGLDTSVEVDTVLKKIMYVSKEAQTLLDSCVHCTHVKNFVTLHLRPCDYYAYVLDLDNQISILDHEVYDMKSIFGDVIIRNEPYGRKID